MHSVGADERHFALGLCWVRHRDKDADTERACDKNGCERFH
jgi:hypothetical protein